MTLQILLLIFFVLLLFFLLALKEVPKHLGDTFPEWSQDLRERRAYCIAADVKRKARALAHGQSMNIELKDTDGEYVSWVVEKKHVLGSFELIVGLINEEIRDESLRVTTHRVVTKSADNVLVLTVAYIPPWSGPAGSVSKH